MLQFSPVLATTTAAARGRALGETVLARGTLRAGIAGDQRVAAGLTEGAGGAARGGRISRVAG